MSQANLRQQLLKQRNQFTEDYQASASTAVCQHIIATQAYQDAQHIAAYLAVGREISLQQLIKQAHKDGKYIYLPRLNNKAMQFAEYKEGDVLINNQFNIAEPSTQCATIDVKQLDLIYLPLVAYDAQMNRIGMGGGYYDRTLASVKDKRQPTRIGVAYKEQQIDTCFANDWDIALHQIITN